MDYKEAVEYIENTGKFGINLGLKRIERLCELLGNPEKDLKIIHVAGTNGKGSTTTFISSILMCQGYNVGIYTSPYIERFTERIKVNNDEISENDIARLVTEMKPAIDKIEEEGMEHPTEFEIITACAFKYFKDKNVDYVVLEVGLGGRFDATNVVSPLLSVITTISYDHINILGDTLSKIAFEKAGIIKEGRPVVIYPQEKDAWEVLVKVAEEKNAEVYPVQDIKYNIMSNTVDGIVFNVHGSANYEGLKINLLGEHQVMNALTALRAIELLRRENIKISEKAIRGGLDAARWPGRFEILKRMPFVVLDGGHNIQGIRSLVRAVEEYFKGKKVKVVCGMLKDKKYDEMISELSKVADSFITVEPNSPRALTSLELKKAIEEHSKAATAAGSIRESVEIALNSSAEDEVIVFCGSLYMIGEARTILLKHFI